MHNSIPVISHPLIRENSIDERAYQTNITMSAIRGGNTLVVLPTGLGKTIIAIMEIAEVLYRKGGRILFLAPTKPLVEQHVKLIKSLMSINSEKVIAFTGEVKKSKRKEMWDSADIIVSTPQVIQNDLISGSVSLNDVSLLIFDEAHRAVGNYAYVYIATEYRKKSDHLILGITASPGGDEEKILEIIENLGIENVEIRTEEDEDVRPYVKGFKIRTIELPMPEELKVMYSKLRELRDSVISELHKFGLFITIRKVSRKDLIAGQKRIQASIIDGKKEFYQAAMLVNMAIKIDYALEYLETQGFESCYNYLMKLIEEGNSKGGAKASRVLIRHQKFIDVIKIARELERHINKMNNPKIQALRTIIQKRMEDSPASKIIVFTHYRNTSQLVVDKLSSLQGVRAIRFVGQARKGKDKGLNQKEQTNIIQKFRNGEYNVLVATSVAEEGIDIPATDMVIFYEPVPSEIRAIQRRGRTGRTSMGKVIILSTKGTRDTAYLWSSRNKEKKMKNELLWLRTFLNDRVKSSNRIIFNDVLEEKPTEKNHPEKIKYKIGDTGTGTNSKTKGQLTLIEFEQGEIEKPKIYVDNREFRSEVVKILSQEYRLIPSQLEIGDYVLSDRLAIERKATNDFLESMRDGRLFEQVKNLRNAYSRPVIIIEGETLFTRGFHMNSIYGAIASILADFGMPVIFTHNAKETAKLIGILAKREHGKGGELSLRKSRGAMTDEERQRFIIESLPGVSATLSQRLLEYFGSVRDVIDADVSSMIKVKGIGRKIAEEIYDIVTKKYKR